MLSPFLLSHLALRKEKNQSEQDPPFELYHVSEVTILQESDGFFWVMTMINILTIYLNSLQGLARDKDEQHHTSTGF